MKMIFMDIDETLIFSFVKITVLKNGKEVKKLTSSEFNSYVLNDGETFDFTEFKDSKLFVESSIPNEKMINLLKSMLDDGSEILLLTARNDFDCKNTIIKYFNDIGVPVGHYLQSKIHIARCGRDKYRSIKTTSGRKKYVIQKILAKRPDVTFIEMYDDNYENLKEFKTINFPSAAYHVQGEKIIQI